MKIGLVFPQTEYGHDPVAVAEYARLAEESGYSHVLAYDHVLGANPNRPGGWQGPYTYENPFLSPFLLFSYWASITTRLEFVTGVIILPQRQTALVAKQAATLDVLCQGRLRLGVGLGWNKVEYEALGQDFHTRGRRIEEQVTLMRRLWTEPLVTFEGKWDRVPDAGIRPLPVQQPIPVWFGGWADAVVRRTARLGDGWLLSSSTPDKAAPRFEELRRYIAEAGRSPETVGIEVRLAYGDGDPDGWLAAIEAWEKLGATHLAVNTMGCGFDSPEQHLKAVETFAEAVL